MAVHLKRIGNDEHLSQAFHYFDKKQTGYIKLEELQEALLQDDLGDQSYQYGIERCIIFFVILVYIDIGIF